MKTLKILGLLVSYPDAPLVDALPAFLSVLRQEKWLAEDKLKALENFVLVLGSSDLLDLQEDYVILFDRTPSLSLHLFEHVHGDSRERGQALVDLANVYEGKGLRIDSGETPDYLPAFMEYLSILAPQEAQEALDGVSHILAAMVERLAQRNSGYAHVLEAALSLVSRRPNKKAVRDTLDNADSSTPDFEQMDKDWEEQFALSLPGPSASQDCPKASMMLQRMTRFMEKAS